MSDAEGCWFSAKGDEIPLSTLRPLPVSPSFAARERLSGSPMAGLLGIVVLHLAAYGLCDNRKAIRWRTVGTALDLQVLIGWVVFAVPAGRDALAGLSAG